MINFILIKLERSVWKIGRFFSTTPNFSNYICKLFNIQFFWFLSSQFCFQSPCIAEMNMRISNWDWPNPRTFLRTKNVSISGRKSLKIIVILTKSSLTSYFKPKIISKTWTKLILIDSEYSKKAVFTMIGDISVDQACSVECALATMI